MLAGRPVELHTADTAGNPAQARTKTQELVERLNVSVLIGPLAAFEALAIDDYIRSSKTPILTVAGAEDMTQRKANPWLVRPSCTSAQPSHPIGDYAAKELKLKRVARDRATTSPSATRTSPASSACSRTTAARWCRSCSRRSTRPTTAPTSRSSSRTSTPSITGHAGSNGFKFIKQLREYGKQGADPRRLHAGRRVAAAADGRRGARRHHRQLVFGRSSTIPINKKFVAAIQTRLQGRSRRLRGRDLSLRRGARARAQSDRRQGRGQGRVHEGAARGEGAGHAARAGAASTSSATSSATSTSARSRRRTASTSTRWSRPIRTSASSGPTSRTSS